MPQNLFKIYDERNYFWQWDTNQKLIVLDDTVDEVHFSNKNMTHAIPKDVITDKDGKRICYIPDTLLTLPKNLVASAYVTDDKANKTLRSVKFAVRQRAIPSDYVVSEDFYMEDFTERLDVIEDIIEDACLVQRFNSIEDAEQWAQESKDTGAVISVNVDSKWVVYTIKEDYSIYPVCDCDEEALIRDITKLQKLVGESPVADQIANAIKDLDLPNTYDAKGAAAQALVDAKKYTDNRVKDYDVAGSAAKVQSNLDAEIVRAKDEEGALTRGLQQTNDSLVSAKKDITANKLEIDVLKGGTNIIGSVDYKIAQAVALIMDNPDEAVNSINELINWVRENETSGFAPKKTIITLLADAWVGDTSPFSQVVTVKGVAANSQIDLQPTATQIVELQDAEIVLTVENDDGTITVWSIGDKPVTDMSMQALITEVTVA